MINQQIAKIFYQMSEYYAMDEVAFKPQAYEKAARVLESLRKDLTDIYEMGSIKALVEIEGIGQGLAEKIEEFIKTGRIKEYEKLKKACPVDLEHLTVVEGLGPKSIKALYEELNIKTLEDLEKAAQADKISKLPHFGKKSQDNILQGIEYVKSGSGRRSLGNVLFLARHLVEKIKSLKETETVILAGSLRRGKETIGDIDILAVANDPEKVMDYFCSMVEVERVLARGETKSMVRLHNGLETDLRIVPKESFGAAAQYFTGSKDHNIELRKIAEKKGCKLNEYGLFILPGKKIPISNDQFPKKSQNQKIKIKTEEQIAGKTEKEIYEKLGLIYIEPELRENTGEIEASRARRLPNLVELKDILGDLQMHSDWSDGGYSIKEMALEAKRLGRQYIAITDHGGNLQVARALNNKKDIYAQWQEIDKLNKELSGIKILKGIEVDIDDKGEPELPAELLAGFDVVLGSIHLKLRLPKEVQTERLVRAMKNPHIDILAHPTGRKVLTREAMALDMDKVFKTAKETGTVLEINAYPERLDLKDVHVHQALGLGIKLSLGTDAHLLSHLAFMEFGVFQARRGWAEKKDIICTMCFDEIKEFLKQHKK